MLLTLQQQINSRVITCVCFVKTVHGAYICRKTFHSRSIIRTIVENRAKQFVEKYNKYIYIQYMRVKCIDLLGALGARYLYITLYSRGGGGAKRRASIDCAPSDIKSRAPANSQVAHICLLAIHTHIIRYI